MRPCVAALENAAQMAGYTIYNEKYFSDGHFSYTCSPCHYMRAWIRVLDAPGCYIV